MNDAAPLPSTITVGAKTVSALSQTPAAPRVGFVLAHGAGAGMDHPFLRGVAAGLAARGMATLRYQFPAMENGSKRPDAPPLAQATVRAAVAHAALLWPGLRLVAGGKSFGGRMSSQAQALAPLAGVAGLIFLGFPLHAAGQPDDSRARHLVEIHLPMLFLQGTRDALATPAKLQPVIDRLGVRATLHWLEDADHSMHVPARSGRSDRQVIDEMLDAVLLWLA